VSLPGGDVQARCDELLAGLLAELSEQEAPYAAAVLVQRGATELHKRARAGAAARRGDADWGRWAGLQNAARNLVLQSSTCRDTAAALSGRKR
jgi:hypothetical protein